MPANGSAGDGQPVTNVYVGGSSGPRLPSHKREWADYRYYGGQPSRYGLGQYRRYADAGGNGYGYGGEGDYFRFGFVEGYDRGYFYRTTDDRVQSVAGHAAAQLDRGLKLFRQGDYRGAADAFRLAGETDQGDAIARIYAGHTLFAIGRYREAVQHLRRAFELQPRIVYLNYDMRGDYGRPGDFRQQLDALQKAIELAPRDADRLFVLGYVLYYGNQRTDSYPVFARALQINKDDLLVQKLMRNAQPSDVELDAMKTKK